MIQGFDPRTGEPVGEPVAETTDADLDAIVAAAVAAFPAWSAFPRRAEALEAVADALDARAGELAVIADTETALGGERLTGEVARTPGSCGCSRPCCGTAATPTRLLPRPRASCLTCGGSTGRSVRWPCSRRRTSRSRFPWPAATPPRRWPRAARRGKGARGSPGHLGGDRRDRRRCAGVRRGPSGEFGLVHGVQAGLRLLRHPAVAAAGFTGSTAGGLALAKIAAERPVPIPFYGELGSVNPCVVLPGAAFSRPAGIATGYMAR